MKIRLAFTGNPQTERVLEAPFKWSSDINLLVLVHTIFFGLYMIAHWSGVTDQATSDLLVSDFVKSSLALPAPSKMSMPWVGNIFTYQFIHFSAFEFFLSMGALWFFGHMLGTLIGQRRVVVLYFIAVILAGVAFIGSHVIFAVFSGRSTVMEGAFAGVLAVMTAAVGHLKSNAVRIFGRYIPLSWVYAAVILAAFMFIFKPSIAYVFVYVVSIWIGAKYAALHRPILTVLRHDKR